MSGHAGKRMPDDVYAEIEGLQPWFHNLHLPGGIQTAPEHFLGDFPAYKWVELRPWLPERLDGWTVLDIGCNAGYYAFELAALGAEVTAVDSDAHYMKQARWAARRYELDGTVRFRQTQVYELASSDDSYDLVLFLGVFYHLRYPLLGLDIAAGKARRLFAFQTLMIPGEELSETCCDRDLEDREPLREPGWPKMAFIEHALAGDCTNWWAPNRAGVEAMLRSSGMKVVGRPGKEMYLCSPDPENPSPVATWDRDEFRAASGVDRR